MTEFAHLVERALARVFDAHGISWEYEPHTIVLERDEKGDVREAFTPDFFLPDIGLYLECTVMRQSLTRRKRRKVRLARERTGANVAIVFQATSSASRSGGVSQSSETGAKRRVTFWQPEVRVQSRLT